ncbi:LOW QUALITY PROTEIN: hypothetical protein QTO34_016172 [Cnephaeus nilssonii]|uniref:Cadherin domain-containing protein n=1 Tax=Cnephaeus nilssonii TaxID=3371016 RepID=A0AA40I6I1_CNENI|nr:LOW QUALITY PROTEIN: hypothetical protein QTO34_016172 [Eptesicus nilssonii]
MPGCPTACSRPASQGLFTVGLHTGEVRTARALLDRDALKQSLVVAVQDHGQPPLSATVTLTVAVADSIPDVLADLGSLEPSVDPDASDLTLYLVVAVAAVSCVFLAFVIILLALRLRRWHNSRLLQASGGGLEGLPASHFVGVDGVQAFLQTYSHEVSLTADSRKSHLIFPQPNYADTLISQESCEKRDFLSAPQSLLEDKGEETFPQFGRLTLLCALLGTLCKTGSGQIRYWVLEELDKGSFVGNISKDLGLKPPELAERGVRIVSKGRTQLFALNPRSGSLVTAGRIDGRSSVLKARDVGINSLQNYQLSPDDYFSLAVKIVSDGAKYPELVLEQALDREEKKVHKLVLIASDGGDPVHSGNLYIQVIVLDANDNPPVFTQPEYRVSVPENLPVGTRLLTVNATDPDEGFNAQVSYILDKMPGKIAQIFHLNSVTGDISILKSLDYEDAIFYEIKIEAQDGPGLLSKAKILVTVLDVNDNAPEITITSFAGSVSEDATAGREVALVNVHDRDSDTHIMLHVADINDNPPAFTHASNSAYVPENNPRGASIFTVTAQDPDSIKNAHITYALAEDTIQGAPLSTYVSINSDTGVLYALRSFDYEQVRDLKVLVTASDSGDPPLSSNMSLTLFILDQNDNAPEILYPILPTDGSTGVELAPRSAEPGYLVTKVVAVDRDSGQNAWLSYRLLKASEPGLFMVGLHTGEVRTARALLDRDSLKQSLVVAVQDHGQPPLSATVTLTVAVANSIPDVLADLGSLEIPSTPEASDLTLYLVVAVAVVSCVFLAFVIILLALRLRRWHTSRLLQASGGGLAGVPTSHFVGMDGVQAFLQTYSHEVCLTADSGKSHLIFPQPNYADTLISQESCEKSEPLLITQDLLEAKGDPKLLQQIQYVIPEELAKGSRVGNLAKDLRLSVQDLPARKLRVSAEEFFNVSAENGDLLVSESPDGSKYPELLLEKPLDREQQSSHHLILTAMDGGDPPRSGTTQIQILVTDANDNAPVFSQDTYRVRLQENVPRGTSVLRVKATDQDEGANAQITYAFLNAPTSTNLLFNLNPNTGDITTNGTVDFEETSMYMLAVEAKDGGVHTAHCSVHIEIVDENDNAPEVTFMSFSNKIPEDSDLGTVIALIKVRDQDSGQNGLVACYIQKEVPFRLESTSKNYYKLVIDSALDREQIAEYNVTVTATDKGKPSLSSSTSITLHIGDINDNTPVFHQASYVVHVAENNPPGPLLPNASDPDLGPNGQVSYSIVASDLEPRALSSYVSRASGVVFAQRAFDHEQLRAFELTLQARDQGSPALSANVSLRVLVGDRNDNAPRVLYPALGPDGSALFDTVPRAAQPGYLVTKVVAVDADSGHNAWLSYHVLQASEPGLFSLGLRTGEGLGPPAPVGGMRDGGQPPLSATATLLLVFADSLQEALPDLSESPQPSDPQAELQFYLVVALALISVLFFLAVILVVALRIRRSSSPTTWGCFQPGVCSKSGPVVPANYSEGTLPYSYNLCLASNPAMTKLNFSNLTPEMAPPRDLLCEDPSVDVCANNEDPQIAYDSPFPSHGPYGKFGPNSFATRVPEELEKGSFVGNIAKDLGLEPPELAERGVRIVSRGRTQLFALNPRSGSLVTAGRIDREELCDRSPKCVGYQLSSNAYFSLDVQNGADGIKYPELVLERALDREEEAVHHLVLTAFDGGDLARSGTTRIHPEYHVSVRENVPVGSRILTVKATDPDEGANGEVTYSFRKVRDKISQLFQLNSVTGDITILEDLDYEDSGFYDIDVEAHDGPGLRARSKVLVTVLDVNDNAPEVTVTSLTSSIQETSSPGTVIALFNVHDSDSGENGLVTCSIPSNLPFTLEKTYGNYYRLLTHRALDREEVSEYNITVMATDHGTPPLSTETHISLKVADINDNPPAFPHASYSAYLPENNPRGASFLSITAQDPDSIENARVTYSLAEGTLQGEPLSSYVSINSDTGVLYALRSFDYEQVRDLQLLVTASDSGDPPLSSNVSLSLFVLDQNDNAPEILYPSLPTDGSTGVELAPRSAEPGYLVTKVVAVDRDSGQNAWLSYRLIKASEPGLFVVGLHTGEVRTARALLDRDALKQSLVVAVQDHGQPPLSATVTLTVAVANSIPDVLADLGSLEIPSTPEASDLTLYLVVAVAVVSCVFLAFVIILLALRLRRWHTSRLLQASGGGLAGVPTSNFVGVDGVRAFLQTYSHEVCLTADSRKSHLIFPQPNYADTLISQESCEKSEPLLITQDLLETKGDPNLHQPHGGQYRLGYKNKAGELPLPRIFAIHGGLIPPSGQGAEQQRRETEDEAERGEEQRGAVAAGIVALSAFFVPRALPDQIRYSIPEELAKNSVVGNLAKDLGLRVRDLPARKLRVSGEKEYFTVDPDSGDLLVSDRIDREQICGKKPLCILDFDAVAEKPLNIFHVAVVVQDINDNIPLFKQSKIDLKIVESSKPGKTFPLEPALDWDAGPNSLQRYHLNDNDYFDLVEKQTPDGRKYPELILKHSLDREEQNFHQLVLTAVDGGDPPQSGTTQIQIQVTDANDNPPVFSQDVYRVSLKEGVPPGFPVLQVTATDQDEGINAEVTYSFHNVDEQVEQFFNLDQTTGLITTKDHFDFEMANSYTLGIEAKDPGDLAAHCSIQVEILDENDCAPEVIVASVFTPLPEDSPPGTVIALIKTRDRDSGENGEVYCGILGKTEFTLKSYSKNYYKLVTDRNLDREQTPEYNITITATDRGKPPLSSSTTITLHLTDVNDNAPVFQQSAYLVHVPENNPPGASIAQVSASDPDLGPNGQRPGATGAVVLRVRERAQRGGVRAARLRPRAAARLELTLQARDQGSPALSANVSLRVLGAVPGAGARRLALFDTVPRAAQPGYLVTKVVAVDADSGHNAWLSYHVLQASEPGLFSLGLRTGEGRGPPAPLVAVRDGGQPPLSATATLLLVFADSLQEALPDLSERPQPSDSQAELQFYLVVALALISVLFLLAVILAVALRLRRSSSAASWGCFQPGLNTKSGPGVLPNYSEGTLPYSYNLCVASQSAKTEFNFLNITPEVAPPQDLLCEDASWVPSTNHGDTEGSFDSDTILKQGICTLWLLRSKETAGWNQN